MVDHGQPSIQKDARHTRIWVQPIERVCLNLPNPVSKTPLTPPNQQTTHLAKHRRRRRQHLLRLKQATIHHRRHRLQFIIPPNRLLPPKRLHIPLERPSLPKRRPRRLVPRLEQQQHLRHRPRRRRQPVPPRVGPHPRKHLALGLVHRLPVRALARRVAVHGRLAPGAGEERPARRAGAHAEAVVAGCAHAGAVGEREERVGEGGDELAGVEGAGGDEAAAPRGVRRYAGAWGGGHCLFGGVAEGRY